MGGPLQGIRPDDCIQELKSQIYLYFPVEVVWTIAYVLLPLAMAKFSMRGAVKEGMEANSGAAYSYLQMQAACPPSDDDIEDTMELILALGFLMMFTTIVPIMPLIALLSNLIQLRLFAFRLSYASQRPNPKGQEGFGAWADIVQFIMFVGVICNVGIGVFVLKPFRTYDMGTKLVYFVVAEHLCILGKLCISNMVPAVADYQQLIEEHNMTALPTIFWNLTHKGNDIEVDKVTGSSDLWLERSKPDLRFDMATST